MVNFDFQQDRVSDLLLKASGWNVGVGQFTERLGLRNTAKFNEASGTYFSKQAHELYADMKREVEDANVESLNKLRDPEHFTPIVKQVVSKLLGKYGTTLWGKDDRRHLVRAGSTNYYKEDLYIENPQNREAIEFYLGCWFLNRIAHVAFRVRRPKASTVDITEKAGNDSHREPTTSKQTMQITANTNTAYLNRLSLTNQGLQQQQGHENSHPSTNIGRSPAARPSAPALDDYFKPSDCMALIQQVYSNASPERGTSDELRLRLLWDAVNEKDWSYLTMHQHYCLLSVDPQQVASRLRMIPQIVEAMKIMEEVLDSNSNVSPRLLLWFAKFPMPLDRIAQTWPYRFEFEQNMFHKFVLRSTLYASLKIQCQYRGIPPLARELSKLDIYSFIFQRSVFTSILWATWVRGQPGIQAESEVCATKLFIQNFHNYSIRSQTQSINGLQELDSERIGEEQTHHQLRLLRIKHEQLVCQQEQQFGNRPAPSSQLQNRPAAPGIQTCRTTSRSQPRPIANASQPRSSTLRASSATAPLYRYVKGFAKFPQRLTGAADATQKWKLCLAEDVNENSEKFQLRCIKWPSAILPDEPEWVVQDTCWVPYTHFKLNGTYLDPRKNLKNLPVDITSSLHVGENILEIGVASMSKDQSYLDYLVAVEILGIKSHVRIKTDCLSSQRIPAIQTTTEIKRKLASLKIDDELSIVQSNLIISVLEPCSISKMCDVPTRGKSCLHFDCFDLETFLQTRDISASDIWKCPICNADARPESLVVDGFMEEVKAILTQQGLLKTRAIVVDQNGNWEPKAEPTATHSVRGGQVTYYPSPS